MTPLTVSAEISSGLDWGVAGRPLPGETESGDLHVVTAIDGGWMVAVIDGLGHGPEAAEAARAAASILQPHAHEPAMDLVRRCHEGLRSTRGIVLSVAVFHTAPATMTWIGVGNVDGTLIRATPAAGPKHETLMSRGGVVGYQLPPLRAATLRIGSGDTLIFTTDGIRSGANFAADRSPQEVADDILDRFAKRTDDALVLVARYLGGSP